MKSLKFLLVLAFVFMFTGSSFAGQWEAGLGYGWHRPPTGHTWVKSDTYDSEMDTYTYRASLRYLWDIIGIYSYVGLDEKMTEEMFPDWDYEKNVYYFGLGLLARINLTENTEVYGGAGGHLTKMENRYSNFYSETFRDFGPAVVAGIDYELDDNYFIGIWGQYSWNKVWSEYYNKTSFDPGGGRYGICLKIRF